MPVLSVPPVPKTPDPVVRQAAPASSSYYDDREVIDDIFGGPDGTED